MRLRPTITAVARCCLVIRLGCAAHIIDDVVIDVPSESQVHRQVIRKRAGVDNLPVDPVIRLYYVEVAEPDLASPTGDAERVLLALAGQWNLEDLEICVPGAQRNANHASARELEGHGGGQANAVVAIWPDFRDRALGVAFDIGSTTIAGHLCDLFTGAILSSSGRMNPQIGFGEDLMSRVSYVMMNEGGEKRLTETVRQALNDVIGELVAEAEVERGTSSNLQWSATRSCIICSWALTPASSAPRPSPSSRLLP